MKYQLQAGTSEGVHSGDIEANGKTTDNPDNPTPATETKQGFESKERGWDFEKDYEW